MPQLGETVTEGTVVRWLKQVGEPIAQDEALFEVSTDKVDAEVPSAWAGFVRALLVDEGVTVPIGTPVALIGATADESIEPGDPGDPGDPGEPLTPESGDDGRRARTGRRERPLPGGRSAGGVLTPVVRRLLDEHDLALDEVVGSGRDGRVTRADVLAAAARQTADRRAEATNGTDRGGPSAPAAAVDAVDRGAAIPGPRDVVVPFSRARLATARAMSRSRAVAAHALVSTEVDYSTIERVRRAAGLSYLPFVARAVIDGLRAFPDLNASVGDEALILHPVVHLGVAVDVEGRALVVPVLHDAPDLRLPALARRMTDVAERARAGRLTVAELAGGTITLTNVGAYGTASSAPILPLGQVAILSTDGVRMCPVATRTGGDEWAMAVHPVGHLSLSFDHRVIDGAYAAAFLAQVRETLEQRDWSDELRGAGELATESVHEDQNSSREADR